jgi:NAD-dependent deacetylase
VIVKVLILTGAGISAESGIQTFRGADGLWEGHRIEDVASPEAFQRNPELVHQFYNERRRKLLSDAIQPNAAHRAIAEYEAAHVDEFLLVTQNIDDLHQRAGSRKMIAMHGELLKARCIDSGELFEWRSDLWTDTSHPINPQKLGRLRPHVVWFGETPLAMERIASAAARAELFLAIGTSAVVYPAAGIVEWTRPSCHRVEINLENTPQSPRFAEVLRGRAAELVPKFLQSCAH